MSVSYIRPCGDVFDPVATHLLRSIPCTRRRCVAFLIVSLVPLRIMYLPRIFTDAELRALDSD